MKPLVGLQIVVRVGILGDKDLLRAIGADLFEIEPVIRYGKADLDWTNKKSRSSDEMNDKSSRPAVAKKLGNMSEYDEVFVGFPIWWYIAPTIVNTFLEGYDLAGKTIIPFATSGGSGMGETNEYLANSCKGAKLVEGKVLRRNACADELKKWAEEVVK